MVSVVLYFQVHQPFRLSDYRIFDIGSGKEYFDPHANKDILLRVARKCYRPANRILAKLLEDEDFRITFSITGCALEQFENYAPEVLHSFQELTETGRVELLGESYHHTLAWIEDREEFWRDVEQHADAMERAFGQRPEVFRNTELIFENDLAKEAEAHGYRAVLAEGSRAALEDKSPNHIYTASGSKLPIILKNAERSDDIAFRFTKAGADGKALTAQEFAKSIAQSDSEVVGIFIDYETFGEHHWEETGIFEFLEELPAALKAQGIETITPSQAAERFEPRGSIDVPTPTSWADAERDVSAWLGNRIQQASSEAAYALKDDVLATQDRGLIGAWRKLLTSDHFYYMATKDRSDGIVHSYFSPYHSPYEAFISYMNVLKDLRKCVDARLEKPSNAEEIDHLQVT